MDVGMLFAMLGTLLGGGGLAALGKLIAERRKPAADVRAIEVATRGGEVDMALKVSAAAVAQMEATQDLLNEARTALTSMEGSAEAARQDARRAREAADRAERRATDAEHVVDVLAGWAHDLVERWDIVRQSVTPPQLPAELAGRRRGGRRG